MVHGWLASISNYYYFFFYSRSQFSGLLFIFSFSYYYFLAVFHVTDQHGNKLSEDDVAEQIQQVALQNYAVLFPYYV